MKRQIDRDKLRTALRTLGNEYVFYLLYDAVELMPPAMLEKLVEPYLELEKLRQDDDPPPSLPARVASFARRSLAATTMKSSGSTPPII